MKVGVVLAIVILALSAAKSQVTSVPLSELVPKSDLILVGVVIQRRAPVLREKDAQPPVESVPNTNTVRIPLPRIGNALGCLYSVHVHEVLKQRKQSELDHAQAGGVVSVFVPGPCFGALDITELPNKETLLLMLSRSTLKAEEYADAVVWERQGGSEPFRRFDPKDCFILAGGISSVISVKKQPDRVREVKRLLGLQ